MVNKRKIVVLGAGFAGLRTAQDLSCKLKDPAFEIILVDKSDVHLFPADFYEVATAFSRKITEECLFELKKTVAIPIETLINKKINFIHDFVVDIDTNSKLIKFKKNEDLHYDYLVVALGSEVNYFGIEGLKEHSFTLKTVKDALKINCHLDQHFQKLWREDRDQQVYINVGGGGATGVELAAELVGYVNCLCEKYKYQRHKVKVQLIEGSEKLVGMEGKGKDIILERFKELGVKVYFNTFITKVSEDKLFVKADGEDRELDNNLLIWTGGVQVSKLVKKSIGSNEGRGAVLVNPYLQSNIDHNIFAAGDNAYFIDPVRGHLPMMAEPAYVEGALIAKNIINQIKGKPLLMLKAPPSRFIVPLGGKYALFVSEKFMFKGFFAWLLNRLIYFRYTFSIMSFVKALKKTFHSTRIFAVND